MAIENSAWDSLVSAYAQAELKYRHVRPTLRYAIGYDRPDEKRKQLIPVVQRPGTLRQEIDNKCKGFTFESIPDVTFLPRSETLVTSEFASVTHPLGRVTLFDDNGKTKNTFPSPDNGKDVFLYGVTSIKNSDDTLAICTGDGVSIWNIDGRMVSQMTHCNVTNCCHVTSLQNGLLATTCVTDVRGKCVTMWDPRSGVMTSQFGSKPEILEVNPLKGRQRLLIRKEDLRMPWFIASDSNSNILISDRKDQNIKVFESSSGKFIRRFDAAGVNSRCARGSLLPQGLCVDEDDNVFVSDDVTKSILLFDRHGEYVNNFKIDMDARYCQMWSLAMSSLDKGTGIRRHRNPLVSPPRKLALSFNQRSPRTNVYNLSFCRHYAVRF